ncbi:MAG: PQQ-binding-like beta-propeller repeat protein [Pirellulales bacterium]
MKYSFFLYLASLWVGLSASIRAEDWPQWMGPQRNNRWEATNTLEKFPSGGPRVLWRTPIAGGYAGPAVVGDRLFVSDFVSKGDVKVDNFNRATYEGTERVLCLDAKSGKVQWKHEYPVVYSMSYPAGPRCTPIVDGKLVYTLGAEGMLLAFDAATGKIVWQHNLPEEYKTKTALWGYAAHPLIDGPRLICLVGGEGSHTVAFDKTTGKELWRTATATEQGYSPPTLIQAGGTRQLILANPNAVNAVSPETGKILWTAPYEATNGSIIMSPVKIGEYLFVGGYSNHNLVLKLDADKPDAKVVSRDVAKKFVSPVNVQPFVDEDLIIGMDQNGEMTAFRLPDGKRLWESSKVLGPRPEGSGTAFLVKNQDRFYLFNEKGELVIAKINAEDLRNWTEPRSLNQRISPLVEKSFGAPAFANGCMYVRNDKVRLRRFD